MQPSATFAATVSPSEVATQVTKIIGTITDILAAASAPAGVAVILAIGITQVVKAFDHVFWRDLKRGEVWALSWIVTVMVFPVLCWAMGVPVRSNVALGLLAGVAAPIVVAVLKRMGLDLDEWIGGPDDGPPTAKPA